MSRYGWGMSIVIRFLSAIAGSKKATAAVATVVFLFLAPVLTRIGLTVTAEEVEKVIAVVIAYLIGQGIADHGKGAVLASATMAAPAAGVGQPPTAGGE